MFLAYLFNSFNFVIATIFLKSLVILLITSFTEFLSRNSDTYKFISPKNLKRLKLGSFGLHPKILKIMFYKPAFSFFFLICIIIFMISFINFNNNIVIFKSNISFSVIKFLINSNIFFRENFYYFFCY